jgi:hypothetical protein
LGAAIGTGVGLMSNWSRAAAEDQASVERLNQAIIDTGKSTSEYSQQIDQAIAKGQKRAFSDDQIRDSIVAVTNATHDAGKALNDLNLIEDLARARKIDLASATNIVIAVEEHRYGQLARMGIQLDANATREQALAALQAQSAGQADAFGKSNLGWLEQQKIRVDELTESWGYALGPLQQVAMLLPGLSAGFTGISAAISGMGGLSGLAGIAPLLVQAGGIGALGTIAYGYSQNDVGTTFANDLANKIFLVMSSLINAAIPGNPLDTGKYVDQMAKNATWDQILAVFGSSEAAGKAFGVQGSPGAPLGQVAYGGAVDASGKPIGYQIPGGAIQGPVQSLPPTDDQIYNAIVNAAAAGNMTVAQYLAAPANRRAVIMATATPGQGNVYGTGGYGLASTGMSLGDPYANWRSYQRSQEHSMNVALYGPDATVGRIGGSGAVANDISGQVAMGTPVRPVLTGTQQQAQEQAQLTASLAQLSQGYLGLTDGIMSANDAQAAFKATQDGVLQAEQPYNQQLSEYGGQLNALTNAYDLINGKKQDGIALTKEEQDLLDKYPDAYGRLTGGMDDATEQAGMLAVQYAENMKKGDELNKSMQDQTDSVGGLTSMIADLILSMDGIPAEVKTQVLLDKYHATNDIADYISYLNSIPLSKTTTVYTIYDNNAVYQPVPATSPGINAAANSAA